MMFDRLYNGIKFAFGDIASNQCAHTILRNIVICIIQYIPPTMLMIANYLMQLLLLLKSNIFDELTCHWHTAFFLTTLRPFSPTL